MDATTLLISVYCLVDEWLAGQCLRQRGPNPTLSDSEVLTIECVGEFWGIDTDKGLYEHFRRHWGDWFPGPGPQPPHHLRPPGGQLVGGQSAAPPAAPGPGGL